MVGTVRILVGLPASGKSTAIKQWRDMGDLDPVFSTDDLAEQKAAELGLTYDEVWKTNIGDLEKVFWSQVDDALQQGKSFLIDRTNLTKASRAKIINRVKASPHEYAIWAFVFGGFLTVHEWSKRLNNRPGKTIPGGVLLDMAKRYEPPVNEEGINYIIHIKDE